MGLGFHSRRRVLAGLAGCAALPVPARAARAEEPVDLDWSDLMPEGETAVPPILFDMIAHDGAGPATEQPASSGVRTDWNGKTVRIPGFIVPLEQDAEGVTAFILVPFVGACIHVPPPPANQLVFVTTERPYESDGLFEAVTVTGLFGTSALSTELADIGYALAADRITPYDG